MVHIDLLPDYGEDDIVQLLADKAAALPKLGTEELLTGVLHNRLGKMLMKFAQISPNRRLGELSETELRTVAGACRNFELKLYGVEGFDSAQVTAGGIKTTGVNPQTMESWFTPHLFICGEVLDIDADCGGYNLQWAWASGYTAGRLGK